MANTILVSRKHLQNNIQLDGSWSSSKFSISQTTRATLKKQTSYAKRGIHILLKTHDGEKTEESPASFVKRKERSSGEKSLKLKLI